MKLKKKLQISILAINFTAIFLMLIQSLINPNFAKPKPFYFPKKVSLNNWQLVESNPIKIKPKQKQKGSIYKSGTNYIYEQNNRLLDIKMYYIVRTHGEVDKFIKEQYLPEQEFLLKTNKQAKTGFYLTFTHQKTAYLTACINPRGGSTVTRQQFDKNRKLYDPKLHRLFPVILGKEDWKDFRCLWTYLSLPIENSSPEKAYQTLETAWISWYQFWHSRFPK
ncbi:MAG: cyanoexosortase A system-associated protein [Crocosphaera sp.]|nr:cyanoexosortase A system-associated protein [Crocosphaera sp.]